MSVNINLDSNATQKWLLIVGAVCGLLTTFASFGVTGPGCWLACNGEVQSYNSAQCVCQPSAAPEPTASRTATSATLGSLEVNHERVTEPETRPTDWEKEAGAALAAKRALRLAEITEAKQAQADKQARADAAGVTLFQSSLAGCPDWSVTGVLTPQRVSHSHRSWRDSQRAYGDNSTQALCWEARHRTERSYLDAQ